MGEYADMIIDGFVDQCTGEVIDGDSPGYPRSMKRKKPRGGIGEERCPRCGKRFKTQQGVADHTADVHGGRLMHRKTKEQRIEEDEEWANSQGTVGDDQDWGA